MTNKIRSLIVVDVQPEYEYSFKDRFTMCGFIRYLKSFGKVLYFYNGEELGMCSLYDLQIWLLENGMKEEDFNYITFINKNYGFFRDLIDDGVEEEKIIKLIQEMLTAGVSNIIEIPVGKYYDTDIAPFIEENGMYIPEQLDCLKFWNNSTIIGGGEKECLYEVELYMKAINLQYERQMNYIY